MTAEPMRIAYLHQYFTTPDMAGATRSYEMARRLAAWGHTVHMICSDRRPDAGGPVWREETLDGIRVHWTPVPYANEMDKAARIKSFFAFAARAARRAAAIESDVVFATSTPLTIALPAAWAAWRRRVPMVLELRDLWPAVPIEMGVLSDPLSIAAARALERFAYRRSARVVALAPGMAQHAIAHGVAPEATVVIPNAADLDLFSPDPAPGRALRARHPWLGNRPMALYVGALGPLKGVDYVPRLAAQLRESDPDICFVVAGDGKTAPAIRQLATELGVWEKSVFMLGPIPKREVPAWLSAADVALVLRSGSDTASRDSVSNKFFDALAAGRPTASNFTGWSADMATAAGCGIVIDARDAAVAAAQLRRVLRDRDWLTAAGAAARRLGEERFDRSVLARDLERVLADALGTGTSQS